MEVGGNNTPDSEANWNRNKLKPRNQVPKFNGAATSDSVLHGKVITNGSNQDGQLITLCNSLYSHIAIKQYPDWADSLRNMTRKLEADFMPTRPRKRDYGGDDIHGFFQWNAPALDTEEDYIGDHTLWDKGLAAGIKRYGDYVNNGEYLCLTIQGQVEPSLWDKTRADVRFAAIQALKCPIALIILMKERATGTQSGLWPPMAFIARLQKTVQHKHNPV